jgi:hypothetical protein
LFPLLKHQAQTKGESMQRLWVEDSSGNHAIKVTSPNCWHGETNCAVGPFSSFAIAQTYVEMVRFCELDSVMESIFVKGDSWYVTVEALQ